MTKELDPQPRKLACWIESFYEFTEGLPTPPIFRKWAAISAVSGALERKCWIHTAASKLFPNMFILLVAPPGVGKDQAIAPMRNLLAKTGLFNLAPISMTHKGMIDHLASEACNKQFIRDGQWISYHSMLVCVPEFGVLVPGHDLAFMSSLNELYNCWDLYEERSRTRKETLRIENPHIHLISGTQPKFLGELFPETAYGMGFTSRIIMVYAGTPVRQNLFQKRPQHEAMEEALKDDLISIGQLNGPFTLSEDAMAAIEEWHAVGCEKDKPSHSKLMHYNARRIMHVLKITMTYCAARSNDMHIELSDFMRAKDTLLEAEEDMPEIFKEIASGGQISEIEETFHYILRLYQRHQKPVSEHRVVHFLSGRVPANQIKFIIDTMLSSKMISVDPKGLNLPGSDRLFIPNALNFVEN